MDEEGPTLTPVDGIAFANIVKGLVVCACKLFKKNGLMPSSITIFRRFKVHQFILQATNLYNGLSIIVVLSIVERVSRAKSTKLM